MIKLIKKFKARRRLKKFNNYKFSIFTQVKYGYNWCDVHSVNFLNKTVELDNDHYINYNLIEKYREYDRYMIRKLRLKLFWRVLRDIYLMFMVFLSLFEVIKFETALLFWVIMIFTGVDSLRLKFDNKIFKEKE